MAEQISYTVKDLFRETDYKFNYKNFTGDIGLNKVIKEPFVHRLSLALVGHFEHFPGHRIQVCGVTEYSFLAKLTEEKRYNSIKNIFSTFGNTLPLLVFTSDLVPYTEIINLGIEYKIPIWGTHYETGLFITELSTILEERLTKAHLISGVMVSVYGVGIVIMGDSGIGKSESAIELLKRGHLFIADDAVNVYISSSGVLMGTSAEVTRNFIEVRGLGIIDLQQIFGVGAILDRYRIDLIIELKSFSSVDEYDRLGTEKKYKEILGIKVPVITIPVAPGRNIATLIEIAALNFRLQEKGYYASEVLDEKVKQVIGKKNVQS